MDTERRAAIVRTLEESRDIFHAAVGAVTEKCWLLCPEPGRWSVFEIVEHVAVAENGMFRLLQSATPVENSLEDRVKEARITAGLGNRAARGQAPERARPAGRFADVPEALAKFMVAREQTIRFAGGTETDLFRVTAVHPLFAAVNGYELLLIMAGHVRRHADQITEIRERLG
jgi:hypothetical protein